MRLKISGRIGTSWFSTGSRERARRFPRVDGSPPGERDRRGTRRRPSPPRATANTETRNRPHPQGPHAAQSRARPVRGLRASVQRRRRRGGRAGPEGQRRAGPALAGDHGSEAAFAHPADQHARLGVSGWHGAGHLGTPGQTRRAGDEVRQTGRLAQEQTRPVEEVRETAGARAAVGARGRLHDGAALRTGHRGLRETPQSDREARGEFVYFYYCVYFWIRKGDLVNVLRYLFYPPMVYPQGFVLRLFRQVVKSR